jgi:hypothetical protein
LHTKEQKDMPKFRIIVDAIPNDGGSRFEVGRTTVVADDEEAAREAAVNEVWDRRLEITGCAARCRVRAYGASSAAAPRQDAHDQAEKAFIDYDFGEGIEVVYHRSWEHLDDGSLAKEVFVAPLGDGPDNDARELLFHVRFDDHGDMIDAYTIDNTPETVQPVPALECD